MPPTTRITQNPTVMGSKPCVHDLRVTVGTIVILLTSGHPIGTILEAYPYLEAAAPSSRSKFSN